MEKRKLTKEDIDKVRNIEGFPIGTDEDIIALSDPPYYTACPNPFLAEFIREHGTPYDEATDDYHREPFAADVSEGKNDPIYMAHTYHTKVPHKAVMRYIMHYTSPNDVVFDGFCGTGMTALAAQMCGSRSQTFSMQGEIGARKAVISDLSPIATFIAHNYTSNCNLYQFSTACQQILDECTRKYGWMFQTKHSNGHYGTINYVVWSDVFICPACSEDFAFWDVAVGDEKVVKNPFVCPKCGMELKKSDCQRSQNLVFSPYARAVISEAKQVPVMINYSYNGKKYEKRPDEEDLNILAKAKEEVSKYPIPVDELPDGDNTKQPKQSHNYTHVNQFYYDRSAIIFSYFLSLAQKTEFAKILTFLVTSILTKTGSKFHNIGFKNGKLNLAGAMPNVL